MIENHWIELKIDSADLLGKFKCPSRYFASFFYFPSGRMTRIFFQLLRRPRFYFVRGEGAALYYGLRKAFRRQIAEYFGEYSDRKSIRSAGRDGGENVEWGRITRILGYRSYRPAFSFSLRYHSLPLSLSLSLLLTSRIQSESLSAVPRGRNSGKSRGTINLDIPLDITWPRPATADKFYRAC